MLRNKKFKCLALVLTFILISSSLVFAEPVHKDLFNEVSEDAIFHHIKALVRADKDNPNGVDNARVTGFSGEHMAADYIAEQFKSYGLEVERQEFPVLAFLSHGTEVSVNGTVYESKSLTFTPPTPREGISAELVYANLGSQEDFQKIDVKGKIALIKRGTYTFYDKVQNASAAGAAGAIIFNNSTGIINGTLGRPTDIPVATLSQEDGESLVKLLDNSEGVKATIKVMTEIENSFSQNIIATLKANRGNKDAQTIVIGAHYDGVDVPAANDNASGTATMLEIARVLSKQKLAYNVKFIAFGAEEVGLVGSWKYVESLSEKELGNIVAMLNMDMVGVGSTMGVMTVNKDAKSFIADLAEAYIKKFGYHYNRGTSSASDHAPFESYGIPVVFLNYGPDPYYHTDQDSLDKIEKDKLYNMGTLVTAMIYDMAKTPMPKAERGLKAKVNKYHNPEIPME